MSLIESQLGVGPSLDFQFRAEPNFFEPNPSRAFFEPEILEPSRAWQFPSRARAEPRARIS